MPDKLPRELITSILSQLPVDSVLRFRCVSKSYCAEIDDPNFIKGHLERSIETNSNLGMIFSDVHPDHIYSVSFDSPDRVVVLDYPLKIDVSSANIKIVGSCNGLLCFSNAVGTVVLINPATRKYRISPFLPLERKTEKRLEWNTWTLGFGYDPVSDDYKVVRLGQFIGFSSASFTNETMIYSLKTNSWRKIPGMSYILGADHRMGMLLGDALHWSVGRDGILPTPSASAIVAFNLSTENFMEVPEPQVSGSPGPGPGPVSICIGTVGNWLSINAFYGKSLDIWVMKEYGVKESWTKLVSVTPNLVSAFKCVRRSPFAKNNGDEFLIGLQGTNIVWYNLKTKTAKVMEMSDLNTQIYSTESFHESLVLLNQT